MFIKYLNEYNEILFESSESSLAPRIGEVVWIGDVYFVTNVAWYPATNTVHVYLAESKITEQVQVAKSAPNTVNLNKISNAESVAKKALKEVTNLKQQVFSIRQHINLQSRNNSKNDTR